MQKERVPSIIEEHDPQLKTALGTHIYSTAEPPNAGSAKDEAYKIIKRYVNDPNSAFAALFDDTVDEIIDTRRKISIMTDPVVFCREVRRFAKKKRTTHVKGRFLQQAVIFSCKGTPTLQKHFKHTDEYVTKMCGLSYREVPFAEDIAFQISLYQQGVLYEKKSAQFWGLGVSRIKHKSVTKQPFNEMSDATKEAMKEMMIDLHDQGASKVDPLSNELTGVRVIPGGPVRIYTKDGKGEWPWRDAYNYSFPQIPN